MPIGEARDSVRGLTSVQYPSRVNGKRIRRLVEDIARH